MRNAGLDEAQAGIKIAGEISTISGMQMTPPLWQKEEEEELKSLLMNVKEWSERGLKFNIQKIMIVAYGPISSWQ